MKVTLIAPFPTVETFGIRVISSSLKAAGHEVKLLFLQSEFWDPYPETVLEDAARLVKDADIIGLSLMTNFVDNVLQITETCRKANPEALIVWGGVHAMVRPEHCIEHADAVCIGEGEDALTEIADRMRDGKDITETGDMWFRAEGGGIIKTPRSKFITDLDGVPFPDYENDTHYIISDGHVVKMTPALLEHHFNGVYMTMPTRGCPFGCTYCVNNLFIREYKGQRQLRTRSVGNVMEELKMIVKTMPGIRRVKFDDDAFMLCDDSYIEEFSEAFKEEIGLELQVTGIHPNSVKREKLRTLVDAGLVSVRMGIEAGSERTRALFKRNKDNDRVLAAARIINEFKDKIPMPQYDIITDNPWETEEDIIETLMFLSRIPAPYYLSIFSLTLYPGTDLYDLANKQGMDIDDYRDVQLKYYNKVRVTFLSKLFCLLDGYARVGRSIPTNVMGLLTDSKLRKMGLSQALYMSMRVEKRIRNVAGDLLSALTP